MVKGSRKSTARAGRGARQTSGTSLTDVESMVDEIEEDIRKRSYASEPVKLLPKEKRNVIHALINSLIKGETSLPGHSMLWSVIDNKVGLEEHKKKTGLTAYRLHSYFSRKIKEGELLELEE